MFENVLYIENIGTKVVVLLIIAENSDEMTEIELVVEDLKDTQESPMQLPIALSLVSRFLLFNSTDERPLVYFETRRI